MKYLISIILLLIPTLSLGSGPSKDLDAEIREIEAEIQANQQKYKDRPNSGSLAKAQELSNYINSCMKEIEAPENMAAIRQAREGTALISFSIYPSGIIKNIKTVKSSGNHVTDRAINQAILNASPCPKFPATLQDGTREISTTRKITYIKAAQ